MKDGHVISPKPNTQNLDPDQLLDFHRTTMGVPEPDPTPDPVTDPDDINFVEPYVREGK